ncbi:uncharacterized protein [Dysidea avara]|uniref:uncharacterized protein isoform X2 n=1 Tax=Dysidea avara TaxID=196820 RepID=UPI00333419DC
MASEEKDNPEAEKDSLVEQLQKLLTTNDSDKNEVMEMLRDPALIKRLMVLTEKQETFLHLAAKHSSQTILSALIQLYRDSNLLSDVLSRKNAHQCNPLRQSILNGHFENTVLLFKECLSVAKDAISTVDTNGNCILHDVASSNFQSNTAVLRFLLGYPCCHDMLLYKADGFRGDRNVLPVDLAKQNLRENEQRVKWAKQKVEFQMKVSKLPDIHKQQRIDFAIKFPKQNLDLFTEMVSILEMPTTEAKLKVMELKTKEEEESRVKQQKEKLRTVLSQMVTEKNWEEMLEYLLSDSTSVRKSSVEVLAELLQQSNKKIELPMKPEVLAMIKDFMQLPEDDPVVAHTCQLISVYTANDENHQILLSDDKVVSTSLYLLCSLHHKLQLTCATLLANLATNPFDKAVHETWIQPLLLIMNYSTCSKAREEAGRALKILEVESSCDPGSWDCRQVAIWMESHSKIEKHVDYRKQFFEAEINGLHLLELSALEMAGLGVKYVSDQRVLSELIDELRRMKMRSVVGRKDIFLSYAHMNIEFSRKIKAALNEAGYSVWIDEAGIRAGHKWRNEIADGIQGCKVVIFIMTERSSNSTYCQNELGLAEEFKKPIVNLIVESVKEVDPGLKLIIQRRQWIDFSKPDDFANCMSKLLKGLASQGITASGGGDNGDDNSEMSHDRAITYKCKVDSHTMNIPSETKTNTGDVQDLQSLMQALMVEIGAIKQHLNKLDERVAAIEEKLPKS